MSKLFKASAVVGIVIAIVFSFTPASAVDKVNTKKLRDAVTVSGMLEHTRALQRIANDNAGTRASGTPGYDASAAYVKRRLERAGYKVKEQTFTFPFFRDISSPVLSQVSPLSATYNTTTLTFSGSGDITGKLTPTVDVQVPPAPVPTSTSGCEAADFTPASSTEPSVALVQRGACSYELKAANAQAAGYDAVIIFNEGQPGRDGLLDGTLGRSFDIPVVGLSFADGASLFLATQLGDVVMRVTAQTEFNPAAVTKNVIADSRYGNSDHVLVVGAHLDSVTAGPGINDNGSGTAAILEIAEEMSELGIKPRQKVRFAFWGAEEVGLVGSNHYVSQLTSKEIANTFANLNFDMIGSPNYVRFVYDGDGSSGGSLPGPSGSAQIEQLFNNYFAEQRLATEPTSFDGRSDYGPFIAAGIPAGGLFSGAEGIKTVQQAIVYGGTTGQAYDPCYHQACDTTNNLSTKALSELADGAAHATMTLALAKTCFARNSNLRTNSIQSELPHWGPQKRS